MGKKEGSTELIGSSSPCNLSAGMFQENFVYKKYAYHARV